MSVSNATLSEPASNKVLPGDKTGLPWELWQIILSWLSAWDLSRVACVCKTWTELVISVDTTRWKELYLSCNEWRHPFWPLNTQAEPPSWRLAYRDQYISTRFWCRRQRHETKNVSCSVIFQKNVFQRSILVGPGLEHESLKTALSVANAYDRVVVHPGIYDEQFEISAKIPFELIGYGELGSVILVVGIQQVSTTARLSNLVLRAPWFTSFIAIINSGYLQIDNCILEDGMICARNPSTMHIKFCTFRHASVILQHMNVSIIENCEFSQSGSANIVIEGHPKEEKNWTYSFLQEHTCAIYHQKRSLHRKKHVLKATASLTSTIHSSLTGKSFITKNSNHLYDTVSHDPSYSFDDPGANFFNPNLLGPHYLGSNKDGTVGCGDLQSMYQDSLVNEQQQLPAVTAASLLISKQSKEHSQDEKDNVKDDELAITQTKESNLNGQKKLLETNDLPSRPSEENVAEIKSSHIQTNDTALQNLPKYSSLKKSDRRKSIDSHVGFQLETIQATQTTGESDTSSNNTLAHSSAEMAEIENGDVARGKQMKNKGKLRRDSGHSKIFSEMNRNSMSPAKTSINVYNSFQLENVESKDNSEKTMSRKNGFRNKHVNEISDRTKEWISLHDAERERNNIAKRAKAGFSIESHSTTVRATDNITQECGKIGHSDSIDSCNNVNSCDILTPEYGSIIHTNIGSCNSLNSLINVDGCKNAGDGSASMSPLSIKRNVISCENSEDGHISKSPSPSIKNEPGPSGLQNVQICANNCVCNTSDKFQGCNSCHDDDENYNQIPMRRSQSEEVIQDSDGDLSILDELDDSDESSGQLSDANDSYSVSSDSSGPESLHFSGSETEFASSEEAVIMLPHMQDFYLDHSNHFSASQGVLTEVASINSEYTRPVPVNVSEDTVMSSYVGQIKGCLIHQCRLNQSKGGLMISLQAHAIISECDISNVGYGIRCIQNSRVVILKNKIHHCRTSGIFMRLAATGLIAGNDIHSNNEAGIDIRKNADPLVQFNQIHHGKRSGVVVLGSGRGQIKKNDIYCNAEAGVYVLYGGNPTISENYIYEGRASGVAINAGGKGCIMDNVIRGNQWGGIDIRNGSCPFISGNIITNGASDGIVIGIKGNGSIENNFINGNAGCGIWMMSSKNVYIHGNQICNNGHCGVMLLDKTINSIEEHLGQTMKNVSHGTFPQSEEEFSVPEPNIPCAVLQYNNIYCNKDHGILTEVKEEVRMLFNSIHANLKDGVFMSQDAPSVIEGNSITSNNGSGVVTSRHGQICLSGNGIYDNSQHGIVCRNDCVINENDIIGLGGCAVLVEDAGHVEITNNRLSSASMAAVQGEESTIITATNNRIIVRGGGDFSCSGSLIANHNIVITPELAVGKPATAEMNPADFLSDPPPRPHIPAPPIPKTIPSHHVTSVTQVSVPSGDACNKGSRLCIIL